MSKTNAAAHLTSLLSAFSGSARAERLVTDEGFQGGVLMNGPDDVRFPTEATSLFIAASEAGVGVMIHSVFSVLFSRRLKLVDTVFNTPA